MDFDHDYEDVDIDYCQDDIDINFEPQCCGRCMNCLGLSWKDFM